MLPTKLLGFPTESVTSVTGRHSTAPVVLESSEINRVCISIMAPFTATTVSYHPVTILACLLIAALALKRVYYELTTGNRRRAMIRENGCQPPIWLDHQGIWGKLLGVDVMKALMSSAKVGRLHQEGRKRNFTGRNTLMFRILRQKIVMTIEYVIQISRPPVQQHAKSSADRRT